MLRPRPVLALALAGALAVPLTAVGAAGATPSAAKPDFGAVWTVNPAGDTLTEYAPATGSGAANVIATVTGADTGLDGATSVAVDNVGRLFVANAGNDSITEYAADATGDAAPIATIAGPKTGIDAPSAIAASNGEVWITAPADDLLEAFSTGTSGDVLPAATIGGSRTRLHHPTLLSLSLFGGVLAVSTPASGAPSIEGFFTNQGGNIAPDVRIAGSKTRLTAPTAAVADPVNADIYVTQAGSDAVEEYDLFAFNGVNTAPTGRLAGSNTGLTQPAGLALTPQGGIDVYDSSSSTLSSFTANARGNATPKRVVSGISGAAALTLVAGAPSRPRDIHVVSSGNGKVTIAWLPPVNDGGGLMGYDAEHFYAPKRSGQYGFFVSGDNRLAHVTHKTVTGLTNGERYGFTVGAINAYGGGDISGFTFATPLGPPTPPRAIAASATNRVIAVAWDVPKHDGGRRISSYRVQWARCSFAARSCHPQSETVRAAQRHLQTPTVAAGRYQVRVIAVSSLGASSPSRATSVTVG